MIPTEKKPSKKGPDDFECFEVLGEGAHGNVSRCIDRTTGKIYAMKKIKKALLMRMGKAQSALLEREIMTQCNHPNILNLFYSFTDYEYLCKDGLSIDFILEFATHGELLKHIQRLGSLDLDCTRFYTAEIVSALYDLHTKHRIIHRDLKPENLLLASTLHLKVSDFGSALRLPEDSSNQICVNSLVGTAEYISPESFDTENQYISTSSDLWALGCIMYKMITGHDAFPGSELHCTLQLIRGGVIYFPHNIPSVAKDLIRKLVVRNPDKRLGYYDYEQIKSHAFFDGIDWDNLSNMVPPSLRAPVDAVDWEISKLEYFRCNDTYTEPAENQSNKFHGTVTEHVLLPSG